MVYPLHIVFDPALRDFTDKISPGPLHLAFFAVKSLLFRAMMFPATPLSKSNPFSNLRTHFDSALEEFKYFAKLISSIQPADLGAFGADVRIS